MTACCGAAAVAAGTHTSPMAVVTESTITCPECGHSERETIPINACRFFYMCLGCHVTLTPLPGDCSYGDHVCPPKQPSELHEH